MYIMYACYCLMINFTVTHVATDLKQQNKFVFTKYYIAHYKVKYHATAVPYIQI